MILSQIVNNEASQLITAKFVIIVFCIFEKLLANGGHLPLRLVKRSVGCRA